MSGRPKFTGTPKPLTKRQRKLLTETPFHAMCKVFQGPGWTQTWLYEQQRRAREEFAPKATVNADLIERRLKATRKDVQAHYEEALALNEAQARQIEILKALRSAKPIKPIVEKRGPKTQTEMVPIALLSDTHVDETVIGAKVGGVNEYNRQIVIARHTTWASNVVNMIRLYRNIRTIRTLVVPVLGDLITGNIHPENAIDTWCPPMAAAQFAQSLVIGALEHVLREADLERIIVPTCVGNHARITKKPYQQSEVENSIESLIYAGIAQHFADADDERVQVLPPESYLSYIDVLGLSVAYHHGHAVKYAGGIGGLAVPLLRYVHRQSSNRRADLYVCGHFHQALDLGRAVVNGSTIGYNAYALKGGFEFEKPKQLMILIDAKYGRGPVLPIWLDK